MRIKKYNKYDFEQIIYYNKRYINKIDVNTKNLPNLRVYFLESALFRKYFAIGLHYSWSINYYKKSNKNIKITAKYDRFIIHRLLPPQYFIKKLKRKDLIDLRIVFK